LHARVLWSERIQRATSVFVHLMYQTVRMREVAVTEIVSITVPLVRRELLTLVVATLRTWRTINLGEYMIDQKRIRVAIIDDNDLVRAGYTLFVGAFNDLELVGTATDGSEAIRLCAETQPDVVLMDLMMPGMNGVVATRSIRLAFPQIQVIILTGFGDEDLVVQALANGAVSCLNKNVTLDEMANAIRAARINTGEVAD
jgi:CheY-like chemotaxis protein